MANDTSADLFSLYSSVKDAVLTFLHDLVVNTWRSSSISEPLTIRYEYVREKIWNATSPVEPVIARLPGASEATTVVDVPQQLMTGCGGALTVLPEISEAVTEIPEVSELLTSIPVVSNLGTNLPGASDVVNEIPEVSELLTSIPVISNLVTNIPGASDVVNEIPGYAEFVTKFPVASQVVIKIAPYMPTGFAHTLGLSFNVTIIVILFLVATTAVGILGWLAECTRHRFSLFTRRG